MHATKVGDETGRRDERAGVESVGKLSLERVERVERALVPEPFPDIQAGKVALQKLELVRLVDSRNFGKYRVQQQGGGEGKPVFLVTMFGATCSKVELRSARKLGWNDYLAAMKHAIERESGYWQNRFEPLLSGSIPLALDVTVRDTDFAVSPGNRQH